MAYGPIHRAKPERGAQPHLSVATSGEASLAAHRAAKPSRTTFETKPRRTSGSEPSRTTFEVSLAAHQAASRVERRKVRFRIPVTVAFDMDIRKVEQALLEAAKNVPEVLETPAPGVRFLEFGENGLEFELRAWTTTLIHRRGKFTSQINFAIYDKLKEHEIDIPNPQRDIHIRSSTVDFGPTPHQQ